MMPNMDLLWETIAWLLLCLLGFILNFILNLFDVYIGFYIFLFCIAVYIINIIRGIYKQNMAEKKYQKWKEEYFREQENKNIGDKDVKE